MGLSSFREPFTLKSWERDSLWCLWPINRRSDSLPVLRLLDHYTTCRALSSIESRILLFPSLPCQFLSCFATCDTFGARILALFELHLSIHSFSVWLVSRTWIRCCLELVVFYGENNSLSVSYEIVLYFQSSREISSQIRSWTCFYGVDFTMCQLIGWS